MGRCVDFGLSPISRFIWKYVHVYMNIYGYMCGYECMLLWVYVFRHTSSIICIYQERYLNGNLKSQHTPTKHIAEVLGRPKAWQREIFDTQALRPTTHWTFSQTFQRNLHCHLYNWTVINVPISSPPHTHTHKWNNGVIFLKIKFWSFRRCITSGKVMSAAAFFNF